MDTTSKLNLSVEKTALFFYSGTKMAGSSAGVRIFHSPNELLVVLIDNIHGFRRS